MSRAKVSGFQHSGTIVPELDFDNIDNATAGSVMFVWRPQ